MKPKFSIPTALATVALVGCSPQPQPVSERERQEIRFEGGFYTYPNPDTKSSQYGEPVKEFAELLFDLHEPSINPEQDKEWDGAALISLIAYPSSGRSFEEEGLGFKAINPGLEILYTQKFAERLKANPSLENRIKEYIRFPEAGRIHILTQEQEKYLQQYGTARSLLPPEHIEEASERYLRTRAIDPNFIRYHEKLSKKLDELNK